MNPNQHVYDIATENEASNILIHFNKDYIIDIIRQRLMMRAFVLDVSSPNIISGLERQYNSMLNVYGKEEIAIKNNREMFYRDTVNILCTYHGLVFTKSDFDVDWYSAAYYLYDFLVSKFKYYLVEFFAQYIYREKNDIYIALNLSEQKKNKDSTTLYGKKMYNNPKMAVIVGNLDEVINFILTRDISLETILEIVYTDKSVVNNFISMVECQQNFFSTVYVPHFVDPRTRNQMITDIRLALHSLAAK